MNEGKFTLKAHEGKNGFTLIELVIVIVVLGILSIVAMPRFIDISSDAKAVKIQSLAAAMKSAARLHRMYYKMQDCTGFARTLNGVTTIKGVIYSGDWDVTNTDDCTYTNTPKNNVPEIMESLNIDEDTLSKYWMLHTRDSTSFTYPDELYVAPFPPRAYIGVREVDRSNPASSASELIATQCYVRYATPNSPHYLEEDITFATSGC